MASRIETNHLENYSNRVELYELDGELNGFDYGASGEVESLEDVERLESLEGLRIEAGDKTYRGVDVQVVYEEDHFRTVGEELF